MLVSVKRFILLLVCLLPLLLNACGDSSPTRGLFQTEPIVSDPVSPEPAPSEFSLSGTLTATELSAVDVDTNDPAANATRNNLPADAQALIFPTLVGGYITRLGTGVAGDRFADVPDDQDWYRITLAAGQTITLTIADHDGDPTNPNDPDFDLFLVDTNTLADVQTSEGLGRQETISVLAAGEYYVQVVAPIYPQDPAANGTGSNYTLSISAAPAAITADPLHFEDDFIAGEVIVKFKDSALAASSQSLTAKAASLGMVPVAGDAKRAMLYRLSAPAPAAGRNLTRSKGQADALYQAKRATLDQVKALRRRADVATADLNYIRRPLFLFNDTNFAS